jgi:hypothetical protein
MVKKVDVWTQLAVPLLSTESQICYCILRFIFLSGATKVPPSELAPACFYGDVRNERANHGQGAGNSKRGPIFDRQSSAAKCQNQIKLRWRYVPILALNRYLLKKTKKISPGNYI